MDKLRLGGMALSNGVLVHGPTSWGAAVRAADGTVAKLYFATYAVTRRPLAFADLVGGGDER